MNYKELKDKFQKLKLDSPKDDLTAHIIFTEDSFAKEYPLLGRTYRLGSDNKAFWPRMGGYSIFAYCLDGSDQGVRLDWYMEEEGNHNGWKVQYCYILEHMQDADALSDITRIAQQNETVFYIFGDTGVHVHEITENGILHLNPIVGYQVVNGELIKMADDRLHGYCFLLSRYLNKNVK